MELINYSNLEEQVDSFGNAAPFSHIVVDNFLLEPYCDQLSAEFPDYESPSWHVYNNAVENKKTNNQWNSFTPLQYKLFSELNSENFIGIVSRMTGVQLFPDHGLHGGGLHIHTDGGNLNPHMDYSIHPKTGLQRKLNIIIYIEKGFEASYGGSLGLWSNESAERPGELAKEVVPVFNRAVIFDTTQNSWHGMSKMLALPKGKFRKSLAAYYMQEPAASADPRSRALFAPRKHQENDPDVLHLIKLRADEKNYSKVYRS